MNEPLLENTSFVIYSRFVKVNHIVFSLNQIHRYLKRKTSEIRGGITDAHHHILKYINIQNSTHIIYITSLKKNHFLLVTQQRFQSQMPAVARMAT